MYDEKLLEELKNLKENITTLRQLFVVFVAEQETENRRNTKSIATLRKRVQFMRALLHGIYKKNLELFEKSGGFADSKSESENKELLEKAFKELNKI